MLVDTAIRTERNTPIYRQQRMTFTRSQWDIGQGWAATLYQTLFWKPFLGAAAWGLYESLKTAVIAVGAGWAERPSVNELAAMLGAGDRYTILGRGETSSRPAQTGTIEILKDADIVLVHKSRPANKRQYHFGVLPLLPILTPSQGEQLPSSLIRQHERYLGALRGFDIRAWRKMDYASLVKLQVEDYGRMWLGTDPYEPLTLTPPIAQTAVNETLCRDTTCRTCGRPFPDKVIPIMPGQSVYLMAVCDECANYLNGRSPADVGMILRP